MAKLSTLLDQIDSGTIVLPEFQRGYVWNREQVRGLMRSLYRGYPVGSLLLWETAATDVATRGGTTGGGIRLMLLDGQQRITSLYGVIRGRPPAFFDGDPKAFTGLYFNVETEVFEFYTRAKMASDPRWVNVTELFQQGPAFHVAQFSDTPKLLNKYLDRLNRLHQITEREFYDEKITGADKDVDEVVDIFNRVNSGGTKLSKGDLALAKVCAQWPVARRTMREVINRWREQGFRFTFDWLLRATTAVATGRTTFEALNRVDAAQFRDALERTIAHTDTFLEELSGRLGLDHDRVLKSKSSVIVVVRLLDLNGGSFDSSAHRDKVLYWYLNSALWARYSATTETTMQRDFEVLERSGVEGLITVLEQWRGGSLEVRPHDFEGSSASRFYPLLYLLTRVGDARDLRTGRPLRLEYLDSGLSLQQHKIFPTMLLRGRGKATENANLCFLSEESARAIGNRPPEDYLAEMEAAHPGVLASQWIPSDPQLWRAERWRDFFAARRELLAREAQRFLTELRDGTAGTDALPLRPASVVVENADDPRAVQVRDLINELQRLGCSAPDRDTEVPDPQTGRTLAVAEAFWPYGLQAGQGSPVLLVSDSAEADLPRLKELGYEVFTSVDTLLGYVKRRNAEAAGEQLVEQKAVAEQPREENEPLLRELGVALRSLYDRARDEAGYTPSQLLSMIADLGPLGAARRLLHAPTVSDGFSALWERGRLDLTVEAVVCEPRFAPLFTEEELETARRRLNQFGYSVDSAA
ncbi:GmrSD restriction endonuclease domain-containing protein [Thermobifida fusca]|uniref:GmrSD restriction endonuclease domain-containing protein n=1 Tax=Thermobifida fusca TaxID=2021 RepID=UPI0018785985|nr:DUF262 domain-containing protein [Thermobifida fusca]QOS59675.1 DUF262 domain-containing protein [Thermobifida fusca]